MTCASHAVGKAILEILDSLGWDVEQQSIIDALISKVQPHGQPENLDIFNNKEIKVRVFLRSRSYLIKIKIKIQPHFKTIPKMWMVLDPKVRMVLRWKLGKYAAHAIYARHWDTVTGKYNCINSWGSRLPLCQIRKSDIEAIYCVSLKRAQILKTV